MLLPLAAILSRKDGMRSYNKSKKITISTVVSPCFKAAIAVCRARFKRLLWTSRLDGCKTQMMMCGHSRQIADRFWADLLWHPDPDTCF